jgi:Tfp pilus assembly protein PilN
VLCYPFRPEAREALAVKRRKFITLLGGAAAVALLGYVVLYYSASPAAEDARKAGEAKTAEEAGKAAAEKAAAEKAAAETAATTIQAQPTTQPSTYASRIQRKR